MRTEEPTPLAREARREAGPTEPERPVPARSFAPPSFVDHAISTALWTAGGAWAVPTLGAMTALYQVVRPDRVNVLGRLYCKGQIALAGARWKAVVHPAVREAQSYLFAQNHTNHFDHVMLYNATPHFKQGIELESHFSYPFYGWFMKARGTIPVRRGEGGQTSGLVEGMRKEVEAGRSILAFPEGTRTRTGRVGPFRKGVFHAAREVGVPIVPVAVTGSFELMRPGSMVLRPGAEITVYCEEPIPTAGLGPDDVGDLAERVRAVVAARVDAYWAEREAARHAEEGR